MKNKSLGRWVGISSRTRRFLMGSVAMALGRVSSSVMTMGITAVVARCLSPGEFGFWAVLTGLPALAAHLDFGIGNALRNKLTILAAEGDPGEAAPRYFFSSLMMFLGAVCAGAALSLLVIPGFPWDRILEGDVRHLVPVAAPLVTGTVLALLLWLALGLGNSGFYAYQETHLSAFFEFLRTFLIMVLTMAAWGVGGKTPAMTTAYFLGLLTAAGAGFFFFIHRRGWVWNLPSFRVAGEVWRELRSSSSGFFLLQISSGLIIYTDSLLVARVAGFASAGDYAVVQKLFLYLMAVQSMMLVPLWAAFTDAHARGDHGWTLRMFRRSLGLTFLVTAVGAAVLAASGAFLVRLWTGKTIGQPVLFPVMALWTAVYGWSTCYSLLLNSIGRLRRQAGLSFAGAVVNIPLAIWWGNLWGPAGVCWAGIAAVVPVAVNNTFEVRSFLKKYGY